MNAYKRVTTDIIMPATSRKGNPKMVFDFETGDVYASAKEMAARKGIPYPTVTLHCRIGLGACYVEDVELYILDIAEHIKSRNADAMAWRAQKAEEERIEAERKAKEEAERKRVERIATIKERREKLAAEYEELYAELLELESESDN
jgi:hypothetical protein